MKLKCICASQAKANENSCRNKFNISCGTGSVMATFLQVPPKLEH